MEKRGILPGIGESYFGWKENCRKKISGKMSNGKYAEMQKDRTIKMSTYLNVETTENIV
jgi:hypothetical protein